MRLVVPHVDDRYMLRVVESERHPGLADAVNGFIHGSIVFGPATLYLVVF